MGRSINEKIKKGKKAPLKKKRKLSAERKEHLKPYRKKRWRRYSRLFRMQNPWCAMEGCDNLSDHVDHIDPYKKGDDFWDPENHQALCISCHAKKTYKERMQRKKSL